MVKQSITLILLLFISWDGLGQVPHEQPDHPKGNSAQIYKALPFYNEACEWYSNGQIDRAKTSLYEAISISFALTEAHLFLADILQEEGKIDSAFYFYNSGIDFAIEQKPHYYFRLFELGMKLGQYHIVQHNLKHFKKLYGDKSDDSRYEDDFPFTYVDYERYIESIAFVYNYQSWLSTAQIQKERIVDDYITTACAHGKSVFTLDKGKPVELIQKRKRVKEKKVKGLPEGLETYFVSWDKAYVVYSIKENGKTQMYAAPKKGKKYEEGKILPLEINTGNFNGYPFLTKDNTTLYFSSDRSGSKDLFVAHIDLKSNTVINIAELERVNSSGDEIAPYLDENTNSFYLSSDGYSGFGGFDLYQCTDHEVIENSIYPIAPRNMGASFNSFHDDVQLSLNDAGNYIALRRLRDASSVIQDIKPKEPFDQIYFEIDFFPTNTSE